MALSCDQQLQGQGEGGLIGFTFAWGAFLLFNFVFGVGIGFETLMETKMAYWGLPPLPRCHGALGFPRWCSISSIHSWVPFGCLFVRFGVGAGQPWENPRSKLCLPASHVASRGLLMNPRWVAETAHACGKPLMEDPGMRTGEDPETLAISRDTATKGNRSMRHQD